MTALTQFARLECPGLWRAAPNAQRVDVVVAFGDASLVISDIAGRALSHWSLAAVARVNPGEMPALYTPSAEATELVEIADETMVAAIETVRRAVIRARPRGGRVRTVGMLLCLVGLLTAMVWWLPEALARHAAGVLPETSRDEIETAYVAAVQRMTRPPCGQLQADRALGLLAERLAPAVRHEQATPPDDGGAFRRLRVVPDGLNGALALPGGTILLGRQLVEDHEGPEVLAGTVLAEALRAVERPPLEDVLQGAGLWAVLKLMTTGHLPDGTLPRVAEARLAARPRAVATDAADTEALLAAFARAEVSSVPFAYASDITGEAVLPLVEGDPMRGRSPVPLLDDGDWLAVQAICEG